MPRRGGCGRLPAAARAANCAADAHPASVSGPIPSVRGKLPAPASSFASLSSRPPGCIVGDAFGVERTGRLLDRRTRELPDPRQPERLRRARDVSVDHDHPRDERAVLGVGADDADLDGIDPGAVDTHPRLRVGVAQAEADEEVAAPVDLRGREREREPRTRAAEIGAGDRAVEVGAGGHRAVHRHLDLGVRIVREPRVVEVERHDHDAVGCDPGGLAHEAHARGRRARRGPGLPYLAHPPPGRVPNRPRRPRRSRRARSPPRRGARTSTSGGGRATSDVPTEHAQADGQASEARALVEPQRPLVVVLGVHERAARAAQPHPAQPVAQQCGARAPCPARRDGRPGAARSRPVRPARTSPYPTSGSPARDPHVPAGRGPRRLGETRPRRASRSRRTRRRRPRAQRAGRPRWRGGFGGSARAPASAVKSWERRCRRPRTSKPQSMKGRLAPGASAFVITDR